jgi:uncharacterized phage-associated protein
MAVHPLIAAKKVCERRTWGVSNLEINKILYFAHMLFLGRHGLDSPLVEEMFQAWDYGPVLPSVYRGRICGNLNATCSSVPCFFCCFRKIRV